MNGRIEREEVISVTQGRDGGASLADWRDQHDQHRRHYPARPWKQASDVAGVWIVLMWFVTIVVREGSVSGWELAGFMAGLVALAGWVKRGRREEHGNG